jgi:hypothetical protein
MKVNKTMRGQATPNHRRGDERQGIRVTLITCTQLNPYTTITKLNDKNQYISININTEC